MQDFVDKIFNPDDSAGLGARLEAVELSTLTAHVRTLLEEAIVSGGFRPGERLLEQNLAQRLRISRTPLREALRQLERDGLVEAIPRRGFFVRRMTLEDIEEVLWIRAGLLPLAARLAAEFVGKEDVEFLQERVEQMEATARKGDVREFLRHSQGAISKVLELCRRPRLIRMAEGLNMQVLRYRFLSLAVSGRMARLAKGMRTLVGALAKRDGVKAEQVLRSLIEQNIENIKSPEFRRILEQAEKGQLALGGIHLGQRTFEKVP